ncbi:hypothetical protein [uncultured Methanobacterium sp.]|uniref:hypothetical protein n=1 Tax=uncultured Methanobacterium sp. TaxID=176306 RepID=UPI00280414D8|nr:hypothetical protein [uncultured Methanobacterium sp.]
MKKTSTYMGIVVIFAIMVMVSGCTSTNTGTEKLLGEYNLAELETNSVGANKLLVTLPEGTTKVRVKYNITSDNADNGLGGICSGNLGVSSKVIAPGSGLDPMISSVDSEYLETSADENINGELVFNGGKTFFYEGSFHKGTLKVYATS